MVKKFEVIRLGSYPFDLLYTVGTTTEEIVEFIKSSGYGMNEDDERTIVSHSLRSGWTIGLSCGAFVLWLRKAPKNAYTHAVLAHEAFHITNFLFQRIDLKLDEASEEAWAYQIEFIVKECYNSRVGFEERRLRRPGVKGEVAE